MLLSSVKSCLRDMYSDFVAPEGLKSKMIQNSTSKNSLNMSKIENGNTNKEIANAFRLEVERIKLENELEKKEMEWNFETMNREYQRELDYKTKKSINGITEKIEQQHRKNIDETKTKQWCAYCFKEAMHYCCWNTSYCSVECQKHHWSTHSQNCTQIRQQEIKSAQQQQVVIQTNDNNNQISQNLVANNLSNNITGNTTVSNISSISVGGTNNNLTNNSVADIAPNAVTSANSKSVNLSKEQAIGLLTHLNSNDISSEQKLQITQLLSQNGYLPNM